MPPSAPPLTSWAARSMASDQVARLVPTCAGAYSWRVGKILLVVTLIAFAVYGLFWLLERRGRKKARRAAGPRRPAPNRTLGPDDDEEFLRQLEQRRRRAAREEQSKARPDDEDQSEKDQSRPE